MIENNKNENVTTVRKKLRLNGFDYSLPYYYYFTICTDQKKHLFGSINNLNTYGKIAEAELLNIPSHFSSAIIDTYVIMPNHIHAIIGIKDDSHGENVSLINIICQYKSCVSKKIHLINSHVKVWQKSYYDTIIINEKAYLEMKYYIEQNPVNWNNGIYD